MLYFDAAYIAKFYLDEPDSGSVRALAEDAGEVACCLHGRIEVVTVFHRKLRERAFPPKSFAALCAQFEADCDSAVWEWLPITAALVGQPLGTSSPARSNRASTESTPTIGVSSQPRRTSACAARLFDGGVPFTVAADCRRRPCVCMLHSLRRNEGRVLKWSA